MASDARVGEGRSLREQGKYRRGTRIRQKRGGKGLGEGRRDQRWKDAEEGELSWAREDF